MNKNFQKIYSYCKSIFDGEMTIQKQLKGHNGNIMLLPEDSFIYIKDVRAGIMYNGLSDSMYNEYNEDKHFHRDVTDICKEYNIKLLQVFEDEFVNSPDIVYNKIKHILQKCENMPKIMGRKCEIRQIKKEEAKTFLNTYHIQGYVASTIYLGAFYNDELIAVMQFREEERGNNRWELTRFASNYNYVCQGVGGKLFKYFVRNWNPIEIKSFADRRWTVDEHNNVYLQLGFEFDYYTNPDYHYFKESDGIIRQHKFGFRKQILNKKYGLPLTMTESQMVAELNYERIYDCGLIKYVWKR